MNLKLIQKEFSKESLARTLIFVAVLTGLNLYLGTRFDYRSIGMIYLIGIFIASVAIRNFNVLIASLASALTWNLFFLPPRFTFWIQHSEDVLLILLFIVAGFVIGLYSLRIKERDEAHREQQMFQESQRIYKTVLNSVSHEIRTPLAAIKGFADMLRNSQLISDEQVISDVALEITAGVERLEYVVKNLLSMSRLDSGLMKLNLDFVDVKEIIGTAVMKIKKEWPDHRLSFSLEEKLPFVRLDYFLVEQTIENLLRNACQHTATDKVIQIEAKSQGDELVLTVTDGGPGFSEESDKLFDRFYRSSPDQSGGLGLGLSICRAVAELHGGSISAENLPFGASFKLTLPVDKGHHEQPAS